MRKVVVMATAALLTMAAVAVPARQARAAGDEGSPASAPDAAPARTAPAPGATRFVTRGGETVEGRISDRLPNGYLVRLANDTTRVVVYEDVASIEGPAAPPPPMAPAPYPVQPGSPETAAVVPLVLAPGMAAEAPERFGRAGQIIMQQGFGFVSHSDVSTTIVVSVAFDFLVTDMLTIGFDVGYSRSKLTFPTGTGSNASTTTTTSSDAQGTLNLGLVAHMADVVSLWPQIGAGISRDLDGPGANSLVVGGQLLLLLHPARHFFIALGPVVRGSKSTEGSGQKFRYTEGFGTGVGGWW